MHCVDRLVEIRPPNPNPDRSLVEGNVQGLTRLATLTQTPMAGGLFQRSRTFAAVQRGDIDFRSDESG